jgi:hypothetical protein
MRSFEALKRDTDILTMWNLPRAPDDALVAHVDETHDVLMTKLPA